MHRWLYCRINSKKPHSLFNKLIEKNPADPQLYSWRAQALIQLNLHSAAESDIDKALSLEKDVAKRKEIADFLKACRMKLPIWAPSP